MEPVTPVRSSSKSMTSMKSKLALKAKTVPKWMIVKAKADARPATHAVAGWRRSEASETI